MNYLFKTYIAGDSEYFEFGEVNPRLEKITGRELPITKTDLPLMESLISFFYLDAEDLDRLCSKIVKALQAYSLDSFEPFAEIRNDLEELSGKHIYFKLLELEWIDRMRQADKHPDALQEYLPVEQIERIPGEVSLRQDRMDEIFKNVLEYGISKDSIAFRMADFSCSCIQQDRQEYPFSKLSTGYELVFPDCFTEVLYPDNLYDLVDFYLRECIRREIHLRRCKSCGRWFALTGNQKWEYCTRVFDEKGRTCRDVGAINTWTAKRSEDEVFKVYRREYKKRFGWIKAGKLPADDFYKWSEQARLKKLACDKGEITLEEFSAWLKKG